MPRDEGRADPPDSSSLDRTHALVRAAQDGDEAALDDLLQRYLPVVRQATLLRLGRARDRPHDVEDIIQECLLDAFLALRKQAFRSEGSFRYWLIQVVGNNIRDQARRQAARKRGAGRVRNRVDLSASCWRDSMFAADDPTPSQVVMGKELEEHIEECLRRLPERYRDVIVQRRLCGLSFAEIGRNLGLERESTVRSLCARAWAKFEELIGGPAGGTGGVPGS